MTEVSPESAVLARYSEGAEQCQASLCCPVSYDPTFLAVLPDEIIEKDYGCGDPTPYVRSGDTVLDLGSGAGKACWIAAQIAGPQGAVIGVDMNRDMLALAKKHHVDIAAKVGFDTVSYRRGMIQDLELDLDLLENELRARPVDGTEAWLALREEEARLRKAQPMIADGSIDVVLSNCVLNLVRPEDKQQLFREIYRSSRTADAWQSATSCRTRTSRPTCRRTPICGRAASAVPTARTCSSRPSRRLDYTASSWSRAVSPRGRPSTASSSIP